MRTIIRRIRARLSLIKKTLIQTKVEPLINTPLRRQSTCSHKSLAIAKCSKLCLICAKSKQFSHLKMAHLNAQWNLISRINLRHSLRYWHRRQGVPSCKLLFRVLWLLWDQQVRRNRVPSAKTRILKVTSRISHRITIRVVPIRRRRPIVRAL